MSDGDFHGMVAVTCQGGDGVASRLRSVLADEGLDSVDVQGVWVATWGLPHDRPRPDQPLLLSKINRSDTGRVTPIEIARWLDCGSLDQLGRMLPPFGAVGLAPGGMRIAVDQMGLFQLFTCRGEGWSAASTSARLLSRLRGGGLNDQAVMLQSQLGYQLGDQTLFAGVSKLAPLESLLLSRGGISREFATGSHPEPGSISMADGVEVAAELLRTILEEYLNDTGGPTLQLSGGLESRVLLSAIPLMRRIGLKAMTLNTPETFDVQVAIEMAKRYGMIHLVTDMTGLTTPTPADWFARVYTEARRKDCMHNPLASAVTGWAEESLEQGDRITGLGGEVARGYYYIGRVQPKPITRRRAEFLAKWQMLANEPVEAASLTVGYRKQALPVSLTLIHTLLLSGGHEWHTATDELYYRHKMPRWAGPSESAVPFDRRVTNPLLDHRFLFIARSMSPSDKKNSRFFARLQMALDDELARIPLDARPAPIAYATDGPANRFRRISSRSGSAIRKVRQRAKGGHRSPSGSAIVAAKLAEHFRQDPAALDPVRDLGVFGNDWLDGVGNGIVIPAPSSLALLMNILVATSPRA